MKTLTITCEGVDQNALVEALEQVLEKVQEDYLSGKDENSTGQYYFDITGEDSDLTPICLDREEIENGVRIGIYGLPPVIEGWEDEEIEDRKERADLIATVEIYTGDERPYVEREEGCPSEFRLSDETLITLAADYADQETTNTESARCASCSAPITHADSIDCTECHRRFCDNCYDTGRGDGCHCHTEELRPYRVTFKEGGEREVEAASPYGAALRALKLEFGAEETEITDYIESVMYADSDEPLTW